MEVTIDSNLRFSENVMYLCATVNCKLRALSRFDKYISLKKRRILIAKVIHYFPVQSLPFDLDDT